MEHEQVRLVSRPKTLARIGTMLCLAGAMVACSGGGNGVGGSDGGSGNGAPPPAAVTTVVPFVTVGPIVASDFVYHDEARVTMNGQPAALEDLHDREIAVVRGTREYINGQPRGTGIDSIDVHHLVIGPVELVDPDHARLSVMSQSVSVTGETMIDDVLVAVGGLAAIQPGDAVAVSGYFTEYDHEIVATRISRRATDSAVLLRGTVFASNPAIFRFRVGEFDVYYGQSDFDPRDFPEGVPKDGDRVVLRSKSAPGPDGTLHADSVDFVARTLGVAENTEVELTGAMTRYGPMPPYYDANELLDVGGFRVHADCTTIACGSNWQSLRDNALVNIIGSVDGFGDVQARYAGSANEGPITLTGAVDAVEPGFYALTLLGFRVQASMFTQLSDVRGLTPATVDDLQVGDVVTARGTYGGTPGMLIAASIQRVPAQDPLLSTWQFERTDPAIVVLGRSILTNGSTLVDRCEKPIDVQRLFSDKEQIDALSIGLQASPAGFLEATRVSIYNHDC